MTRAVHAVEAQLGAIDALLVDARTIPDVHAPQRAIIGGDAASLSIAAASILAKVARDALMVALAEAHPGYGFERHKGYGTAEHQAALARLGPCPAHRTSFAPVRAHLR
jgi:ribonuclease HII